MSDVPSSAPASWSAAVLCRFMSFHNSSKHWISLQDSAGVEEVASVVLIVIGSCRVEAADFDPFGGLNERFVTEINGDVSYPFETIGAGRKTKKQQVAFFQFREAGIEWDFPALSDLFACIAIQFKAVHE